RVTQQFQAANSEQPRIARAGADEIDFAYCHSETPSSLSKWLFARANSPRMRNCRTSPLKALRHVSNGTCSECLCSSVRVSAASCASCSYSRLKEISSSSRIVRAKAGLCPPLDTATVRSPRRKTEGRIKSQWGRSAHATPPTTRPFFYTLFF